MWQQGGREQAWARLAEPWDMIVVGGGITGAGVLREATRLGLRVLLIEGRDFSWGASSRSSKFVHGGLRYLAQGEVGLVRESVRERERLLADAPGLVEPLGFCIALYKRDWVQRWLFTFALAIYDLLAGARRTRHYDAADFTLLAPHVARTHLRGGLRYLDAQTDDSRLVLRLLRESVLGGALVLNYARAESLLREGDEVVGLRVRDEETDHTVEVRARVVVNATGVWVQGLRDQIGSPTAVRPLRGSHLVFAARRLPVTQAITFLHPDDRRPVFATPWEGATIFGTTDLDHGDPLNEEPRISPDEVRYLLKAVQGHFPTLALTQADVISTWAGVRPVIGEDTVDPSCASREHVVWQEQGLLTVAGGKLTTFRPIALDVLESARARLPHLPPLRRDAPLFEAVAPLRGGDGLTAAQRQRLLGRYGQDAHALVAAAQPGELTLIPETPSLWAELRWAARSEGVCHLDDLLLRRVRVGMTLPEGGAAHLPRIRASCQEELGWDDARWEAEARAYTENWQRFHRCPAVEAAIQN